MSMKGTRGGKPSAARVILRCVPSAGNPRPRAGAGRKNGAPRGAVSGWTRRLLLHRVLLHFVLLCFRSHGWSSGCGVRDLLGLAGDIHRHRNELAVLHLIERDRAVLRVAVLVELDLRGDAVIRDLG